MNSRCGSLIRRVSFAKVPMVLIFYPFSFDDKEITRCTSISSECPCIG